MLRAIALTLALLSSCAPAYAQNASAAAGQTLGTTLRNNAPLPSSNGAGGINVPTGQGTVTMTPSDLVPSGGASSQLSNSAGNDAAILGAANNAASTANADQSAWGAAYRTLGQSSTTRRPSLKNDPMWANTNQAYQNIFSNNFTGCQQIPSSGTTTTVHVPDIKHCVKTAFTPLSCTITHGLGSNIVPAAKRCDPATFQTIKLQIYNTPNKKIWDNIACTPQGNFQHNLVASTTSTQNFNCSVVKRQTKTCFISHNYSANTGRCAQGKVLSAASISGIQVPYQYGSWTGTLNAEAICPASGNGAKIKFSGSNPGGNCDNYKWYRNLGHFFYSVSGIPGPWRNAGSIYYIGWSSYFYCYAAPPIQVKDLGCQGGNCSVKIKVQTGTHKACSDGGSFTYWRGAICCGNAVGRACNARCVKRRTWWPYSCIQHAFPTSIPVYKYITLNYSLFPRTVTDNGWVDQTPGCTATAQAILAGTKQGTVQCTNDPSNGGTTATVPGGTVNANEVTPSPFAGVPNLCQTVTVTEVTNPGSDTCTQYANDPNCTQASSTVVSPNQTDYTYSCSTTTTTNQLLTGCGGGACSANL